MKTLFHLDHDDNGFAVDVYAKGDGFEIMLSDTNTTSTMKAATLDEAIALAKGWIADPHSDIISI